MKIKLLPAALLLPIVLLASCAQHTKTTVYQINFSVEEYTLPQDIEDPEARKAFEDIISVFEKAQLGLQSWTVDIVNDRFDAEDRNAEAKYENTLTRVKACESQCRKIIDGLGPSESSFYLKPFLKMSRWVAADGLTTQMQEYRFELRYN